MGNSVNILPELELPKRWELLSQRAQEAGVDPREIVERVDSAATRIDYLLRRIRTGGGGLFEIFLGLSGSGKTTFLHTLPKFFTELQVHSFPKECPLHKLPAFLQNTYIATNRQSRIILIERRDNPKQEELVSSREMFSDLLEAFRSKEGAALVVWPITHRSSAEALADIAWDVGRDSICESSKKGIFNFDGLPREKYFHIADTTSRNLTGDSLEAFGVTEATANTLLSECHTISDFFNAVDSKADEVRGTTWSILKERVRARIWVVLPGDIVSAINGTVSALTQGTRSRIDLDMIGEFIDRPDNNAVYVAEWRKRRSNLAHILRTLDVRVFGLPPNVALAAVRAFGDSSVKSLLKQPSVNRDQALSAMRATRLYKAILAEANISTEPFAGPREVSADTSNEYRRIQATAERGDKMLNKALGLLIQACLEQDAPDLQIVIEKRALPGSALQPDIQVGLGSADFICIEPTWRSTAQGIPGELDGGQNTLAEAHIKKYVLDKSAQYVRDLGL